MELQQQKNKVGFGNIDLLQFTNKKIPIKEILLPVRTRSKSNWLKAEHKGSGHFTILSSVNLDIDVTTISNILVLFFFFLNTAAFYM